MAKWETFGDLIEARAPPVGLLHERKSMARTVIRPHQASPEQVALLRACKEHRMVTSQANRRAGKTRTIGSYVLARSLCKSDHVTRILTHRLSSPSQTYLDNGQTSVIDYLAKFNILSRCRIDRVAGAIKSIRTPWNSAIYVHDIAHAAAIDAHRGVTADIWWGDEAQHLALLHLALSILVFPTLADRDGRVFLSGTPGRDIDTAFYSYSRGNKGWHAQTLYSWHNPAFGPTVADRWRHILDKGIVPAAAVHRLSDDDVSKLRSLDPTTLNAIASVCADPDTTEWVQTLDPHFRREFLGLWVAGGGDYVLSWHDAPIGFYYAQLQTHPFPTEIGLLRVVNPPNARDIDATPLVACLRSAMAELPKNVVGRACDWHASVGLDLGWNPSSTAWSVLVWSPQHPGHTFELFSDGALELPTDLILDKTLALIVALRHLGVRVVGVRADTNGTLKNLGAQWSSVFASRFGTQIPIMECIKTDKEQQYRALDVDILRGQFHVIKGSRLDIEGRHLRFKAYNPDRPTKAKIDKDREIVLPDGRTMRPGDHAIDATRYAMADCPYALKPKDLEPLTEWSEDERLHHLTRDNRLREGFATA